METVIVGWKKYFLVQPPVLLLFFAQSMSSAILTDLIENRVCTVTLNINETECNLLHINSSSSEAKRLDNLIQPRTSVIIIFKSLVDSFLPAVLSLFIGPWSDKYGRKPLLISGYSGITISFLFLSLLCYWKFNPWFLLLTFVPAALSGGICILILATICYISDITNETDRAWQLAYLQALINFGILTGTLIGPIVFNVFGYGVVFSIGTVCCFLSLLYTILLVPESIQDKPVITVRSLFNIHLVWDLIATCVKKRDGFNRFIVWCCILTLALYCIIMEGEMTIAFLFASARLGWNVQQYSVYSATNIIFSIIGSLVGVKVLAQYKGVKDVNLAILAIMSGFAGSLMRAFTRQSWHIYLATITGMFGGISSPIIRTMISKSVPRKDTGKVFSLTTSVEVIMPFGSASLYSLVYSNNMPPIFPSPAWLVSSGMYVFMLMLIILIHCHNQRRAAPSYAQVSQEGE
ncbi:probable peptidoglycan muropeptide transporter SLC46 [Prorops nasuta]|uniref:probable peptidoglycan muropeptide transporter SLC46 n=1 Tax=Prorops nasuta TaxID=863751 RepID=UPI0034CF067E